MSSLRFLITVDFEIYKKKRILAKISKLKSNKYRFINLYLFILKKKTKGKKQNKTARSDKPKDGEGSIRLDDRAEHTRVNSKVEAKRRHTKSVDHPSRETETIHSARQIDEFPRL